MNTWHSVHKLALKSMRLIKSAKVLSPQADEAPHQIEEIKWFINRSARMRKWE
jgi:hypothetical protein